MKLIIKLPLYCPYCGHPHIDDGSEWENRAHTTHRCRDCLREWEVYVSGEGC